MTPQPAISFIVPALNEAAALPALLGDLRRIRAANEVIVADGGSTDATRQVAATEGAVVVTSPPGRGCQLRRGAATARADILCFLHADVRLDAAAAAAIDRAHTTLDDSAVVLSLRIAGSGIAYRVIERAANLRSRVAALPYGDQGLLLSRDTYTRAGGFPDVPLMEDVALMLSLRRHVRIRVLAESVTVSARRWERDGVARRTLHNWSLLLRYLLGGAPESLAAMYPSDSPRSLRSAHQASQSSIVSMSRRVSSSDTRSPAAAAADSVAPSVSDVLQGMPPNSAG
jgi:rSAM/selenodomain-associated transferase 2